MRSLANYQDSDDDDDKRSDDDVGHMGTQVAGTVNSATTAGAPDKPKRQHDFLKSKTDDGAGGSDSEDHESVSKLQRQINIMDDQEPLFTIALANKDWKKASTCWNTILDAMKYVFSTGVKLPFPFLSAIKQGQEYFSKNSPSQLKEEVPRELRKIFTDLVAAVAEHHTKYATQIEHMDSESDDDSDEDNDVFTSKNVLCVFKEGEEVTEETIGKKIQDILNSRGKKGTDKRNYNLVLMSILSRCDPYPKMHAFVCSLLMASILDAPRKGPATTPKRWTLTAEYLNVVIDLMEKNPEVVVEEDPNARKKATVADEVDPFILTSTVSTLTLRMHEEYMEGVRTTDLYSDVYLSWLRAESLLVILEQRTIALYSKRGAHANTVTIAQNLLDLLYYRKSSLHTAMVTKYGPPMGGIISTSLLSSVKRLNSLIQKSSFSTPEMKLYATLALVFHLAEGPETVGEALRLFHMSKATETITTFTEARLRILYNRVLVQLSVAMFLSGSVETSGYMMSNLYSLGPRYKELLAQANQQRYTVNNRSDKMKRDQYVPPHMHVNTEISDTVFFLWYMIFQDGRPTIRENNIYRSFVLNFEKQYFLGPPENYRERIYAAIASYRRADWHSCETHIRNISSWSSLGPDIQRKDFLAPLIFTIKVRCMKSFLMNNSGAYSTIAITHLAEKFCLPPDVVCVHVTQMILQKDVSGILNEDETYLSLENTQYGSVQQSLVRVADKALLLADFSERIQKDGNDGGATGPRQRRTAGGVRAAPVKQLAAKGAFISIKRNNAAPANANKWVKK